MTLKLIKPILQQLKQVKLLPTPAPSVEVTQEAEQRYNEEMRRELKKKVRFSPAFFFLLAHG
jgi:hypothetical protein